MFADVELPILRPAGLTVPVDAVIDSGREQRVFVERHCEGALQFGGNGMDPIFETAEYSGNERIQTFNEIHVSLGYYDRLIDPALPQWEQWRKTLDIVRQHGFERVVSLLFFILRHNARLLKNGIVSSFESLR